MNKGTSAHLNRQSSFALSSQSASSSAFFEKDLKVDKRILDIMYNGKNLRIFSNNQLVCLGGNDTYPSSKEFFGNIIEQTHVKIEISSTFRDRQGNEIPIVKVKANNIKNLEAASALIMEHLDPHRDKMTFNIDVPYNDHSYIIGKDGSRIKQLSRDTGCHIHLPDCNKTSGKKSNKLSIAGTSFESIEKARNQIRKSLPLNVGFKARIKSRKFVHIDTASSEVQSIKRRHRVDVTFTNVISSNKFPEVTINVKGGRAQLEEIKTATQELYYFVTGEEIYTNPSIEFTIMIDVSHAHHQYVRGKNNCNLKVIHQRSQSTIAFPSSDSDSNQVLITGRELLATVMGWQELMGYLPLLLSFDVNFDISQVFADVQRLEKEYGVGIRTREKLSGHVYTVLIKTQERHSIILQEIRHKILELKSKAALINDENSLLTEAASSIMKSNAVNSLSEPSPDRLGDLTQMFATTVNYSKSAPYQPFFSGNSVISRPFSQLNRTNANKQYNFNETNLLPLTTIMSDLAPNDTFMQLKSNSNLSSFNPSIIDSNPLNTTYDPFKSFNEKSINSPLNSKHCELSLNASTLDAYMGGETRLPKPPTSWNVPPLSIKSETNNLSFSDFSAFTTNATNTFNYADDLNSALFSNVSFEIKDDSFFNSDTSSILAKHLVNKTQPVIN